MFTAISVDTDYIIKNFPHQKNKDIAAHCGISESTLHRIARVKGLKKTPEQMERTQRAASAAGAKVVKSMTAEQKQARIQAARNSPNARCFQKGHNIFEGKSEEYRKEFFRKCAESWKKTRKLEQARIDYNLPQKTKFRFPLHTDPRKNRQMYGMRYYLKLRGYIVDGFRVSVTETTQRGRRDTEEKARKLGFKFTNF